MPWYYFYSEKESKYKTNTFYNPDLFAFSNLLTDNYTEIKNEVNTFLASNKNLLNPYFNKQLVNAPDRWKALSFYFWGIPTSTHAIRSCPKTMTILDKIPNVLSASISVMEPHAEIKPHYGDTDAIYRCHLGIEIPSGLPECGFRVGYEDRAWESGKLLVFNDAAYHKGWNHTDKRRVILIFDVLRPEFYRKKKWICAMIRGHILMQILSGGFSFFKNKNRTIKTISVFLAVTIYIRLLLKINIK